MRVTRWRRTAWCASRFPRECNWGEVPERFPGDYDAPAGPQRQTRIDERIARRAGDVSPLILQVWPRIRGLTSPARQKNSRVQFDGLDDFVQVVGHLDGAVGEGHALDAALAELFFEGFRIRTVIRHRG